LWEILVDPLWPVREQPFEVRLDLARKAVKDLVTREWIGVFVDRGWPTQSSDEPKGQELAAVVDDEYGGKAERVWTDAKDGADLRRRLESLPGFGKMKVTSLGAVLAKRFDVAAAHDLVPNHPTLGDVDSPQALEDYQAKKRAHKAEMRARRQPT